MSDRILDTRLVNAAQRTAVHHVQAVPDTDLRLFGEINGHWRYGLSVNL